ncbi:MAG: 30S ribosomal protein S17, partial [Planctomycetales bacterium]|nr:30S ribosomal protein S17 [Planctomycetales bacterium]NIM07591.1 30S ribosomal protein S17 [Planctomycetales bacterium]NIN07097.1 30S ribosomal protein S17 [Planctomycetales bacterium]NIN76191.1 30S ribosomal protein S17 [Planctomycetales bacterium]NIO33413.1 30S ribosomal protein S17 [Planctomycetales bacterium]
MPKKLALGIVTKDSATKTRRVEVPRLVKSPKYHKYLRRRTVCHVHDEREESKLGDTVEIVEARPFSKTKRWELVRVVTTSQAVDLAALRAANRALEQGALEQGALEQGAL